MFYNNLMKINCKNNKKWHSMAYYTAKNVVHGKWEKWKKKKKIKTREGTFIMNLLVKIQSTNVFFFFEV